VASTGDSEVTVRQEVADRPGDGLVGVALAAGEGRRLRPLSLVLPKPLCPVGNRALLDHALDRLTPVTDVLAVNAHHGLDRLAAHVERDGRPIHLSVERPVALGTAGALGRLRPWIDGRATLVTNADAWLPLEPAVVQRFVAEWDGERTRLLCVEDPVRADFGTLRYAGLALLPWTVVASLPAEPAGLYEVSWRAAATNGDLDLVCHDGPFVDCGTVGDYLAANLASLDGTGATSVIAPDARVSGSIEQSVVWSGADVRAGERLFRAVRTPRGTVLVR